jgi:hypothetical protein
MHAACCNTLKKSGVCTAIALTQLAVRHHCCPCPAARHAAPHPAPSPAASSSQEQRAENERRAQAADEGISLDMLRDMSRQEYLAKREDKKLQELKGGGAGGQALGGLPQRQGGLL